MAMAAFDVERMWLWHRRLGHQGQAVTRSTSELFKLSLPEVELKSGHCVACVQARASRKPKRAQADSQYKTEIPLGTLHVDLAGPTTVRNENSKGRPRCASLGGAIYALVAVDEWTHAVFVQLLEKKSEAADKLINLIKQLQIRTGRSLIRFHSDGGGEFIGDRLLDYLSANGTRVTHTTAATPQHNAIAERMIRTLFEITRALLIEAGAPESYWGEALLWAAHLYNSTPHPVSGNLPPFQRMFNYRYNVSKLRVWGCDAYMQLLPQRQAKLQSRTTTGIFVGFDETTAAYRIMNPVTHMVSMSNDVQFNEQSFTQIRNLAQLQPKAPASAIEGMNERADDRYNSSSKAVDLTGFASSDEAQVPEPNGPSGVQAEFDSSEEDEDGMAPTSTESDDESSVDQESIDVEQEVEQIEPVVDQESGVDAFPPILASREMRALHSDNQRFGRWNDASVSAVSDRASRHGRAIRAPIGSIASDPGSYDPDDLHQAMHERILFFAPKDEDREYAFKAITMEVEPQSYREAIESADAPEWRKAMEDEMNSLKKLGVCKIVECPKGVKPLKGKWVYKNKLGDQNQVLRRKARFVVKGFLQVYGRDFFETHSPVAKMKSIKLILSLAARLDLELHQIDFDTAFLNAELEEEIYMEQPEGFTQGRDRNLVWKLLKALYGLKQAPREWNKTLDKHLRVLGYKPLVSDSCVYLKKSRTGKLIILCLYVDDTVIAFDRVDTGEWFADKKRIGDAYPIKDMGECTWILNMKVIRDRKKRTITLSQEAYVKRTIKLYGMDASRVVSTPAVPGHDVSSCLSQDNDADPLDMEGAEKYRSLVGSLLYAANITRPDIAFTVGRLSRHVNKPSRHHMNTAKRVLRYLQGTPDLCMVFGQTPIKNSPGTPAIEVYSDSDWAGDKNDSKSTSGCLVRFNRDVMNWYSKKQRAVALSSTESEYIALSEAVKEALWYRSWVREVLGYDTRATIYCDNIAAIYLSRNDAIHDRSKHIRIRYHHVRDEVKVQKSVELKHIHTQLQQADILTKSLGRVILERLREKLLVSAAGE
jgi:hypothetical protein